MHSRVYSCAPHGLTLAAYIPVQTRTTLIGGKSLMRAEHNVPGEGGLCGGREGSRSCNLPQAYTLRAGAGAPLEQSRAEGWVENQRGPARAPVSTQQREC